MPTNPAVLPDAFAANLEAAEKHLARFRTEVTPHFIGGRPEPGEGGTFDNVNPVDNTVLGRIAAGGPAEIDRAAAAAAEAFSAWRDVDGQRRRAILHDIADRIERRSA